MTQAFSDIHQIKERAISAYFGLALGDALGATTEFMIPAEIQQKYGVHDKIIGGGWLKLKAGEVTDDTTMSLYLGKSILDGECIDAGLIAEAFSEWLSSKPVDVGNTVRRGIVHYRYSNIPRVEPSEHDAGNGACMRALPVILATYGHDLQAIIGAQREQGHVTHNNALSDAAIDCVTAMLHAIFNGAGKEALLQGPVAELIKHYPLFKFRQARITNPSGYIVDTMKAVLQAFFDTDNFRDCLVEVVNLGGDSDTTAAIAGYISGAYYGLKGIPGKWLNTLNDTILMDCEEQALALIDFAVKSRQWSTSTVARQLAV